MTDRYGVWQDKSGCHYIAHDTGVTFVKSADWFTFDEARRLTDLANDGLRLHASGWRSRLARRLVLGGPE